jgi:hypothetical protein
MSGMYSFARRVLVSMVLTSVAYGQGEAPKRESPYETVMRLRREAATKKTPESPAVGPVVARAELELVPPARGGPTGILGLHRYDTTRVKPEGLKDVPPDAPREPFWFVIRVGDREVPGATYRSTRSPAQTVFCLDTDGDGLLSDERRYVGVRLTIFTLTPTYQFGPVYLRPGAAGPGGDVFYVQCSDGQWFTLWPAFYREGRVTLNGKSYRIALVDHDFDGRFNESFVPPAADSRDPQCDVLALDLNGDSEFDFQNPGASEIMPLCRLIKVDGSDYSIDVAEDGSTIEFRQAHPAFGELDLGKEQVLISLWSDAGHQRLTGTGGKLSLPAGRYAVVSLELTKRDSGDLWSFQMAKAGAGTLGDFEIKPGATTTFKIGPPFQVRASMQRYGQNPFVTVGFELQGQGGELYTGAPKKNGKEAPEPGLRILNGAGQVVHSGQFAYS